MIAMIEKSNDFPIPFYAVKQNDENDRLQIGDATLTFDPNGHVVFAKVKFEHNDELEKFNSDIFNELTAVITNDAKLNDIVKPSYSANMIDEEHVDGVDCIDFKIYDKVIVFEHLDDIEQIDVENIDVEIETTDDEEEVKEEVKESNTKV